VLTAAPSARAGWGPEQILTGPDYGSDTPRIAFDSSGGAVLGYERLTGALNQIEAIVKSPDGTFGPPLKVSGPDIGPNDVLEQPDLASNRRGDVVLSWSPLLSVRSWVVVRRPGREFGPPRLLRANLAHVALNEGGAGAVAYHEQGALKVRTMSRAARSFGRPTTLIVSRDARPSVAVMPDDRVQVAWLDVARGSTAVFVATGKAGRRRFRTQRVFHGRRARAGKPSLIATGAGRQIVAWRVHNRRPGLRAVRLSSSGKLGRTRRLTREGVVAWDAAAGRDGRVVFAVRSGSRAASRIELVEDAGGFYLREAVSERRRTTSSPRLAVGRSGAAAVAWSEGPVGRREIRLTSRATGDRFRPVGSLSAGGPDEILLGLSVDDAGDVVAGLAGGADVAGAAWAAGQRAPAATVVSSSSGNCVGVVMDAAASGFAAMLWLPDCGAESGANRVLASVRRPGAGFASAEGISAPENLSGGFPAVRVAESGRILGVWFTFDPDTMSAAEYLP
jgi:hypothetical protein